MPLFDYRCIDCNHQEEVLVQVRELNEGPVVRNCQKCGGAMEKELSVPAAVFFGGVISSCSMKKSTSNET